MSPCPDIQLLLAPHTAAPDVRAHVDGCEACQSVAALLLLRRGLAGAVDAAPCAEFEPAIAASSQGAIAEGADASRLAMHLSRCDACSEVAARMKLLGAELADVPSPGAHVWGVVEPRYPTTDMRSGGEMDTAALKRGARFAGRRAMLWSSVAVAACALAACAFIVRHPDEPSAAILGGHGEAEAAPGYAPAPVSPAHFAERLREAELRARDAEQRARDAEQRARDAERRARDAEDRARAAPEDVPPHPPAHVVASSDANAQPGLGYLTLICSPSCEEILDGDKSLGPSPIVRRALPAGTHTLTLRGAASTERRQLVIQEGQLSALRIVLQK